MSALVHAIKHLNNLRAKTHSFEVVRDAVLCGGSGDSFAGYPRLPGSRAHIRPAVNLPA